LFLAIKPRAYRPGRKSCGPRSGSSLSLSLSLLVDELRLSIARHVIGRHCPRDSQRSRTKGSSVMVPHCLPACLRYPREAGLRCANFDPWHELSTSLSTSLSLSRSLVHLFCLVLLVLLSTCLPLALTRHFARADILYARSLNDDSIKLSQLNAIIANSPRIGAGFEYGSLVRWSRRTNNLLQHETGNCSILKLVSESH